MGLGLHGFEIGADALSEARSVNFTFQWRDTQDWIGKDFHVAIASGIPAALVDE